MANADSAESLRTTSIRGALWAGAGAAGQAGVAFASFIVLSRLLGPEIFGLMALIESVLALGQQLMSSGLAEPLVQMPKADRRHSETLFWVLQGFGLAAVAAVAGAAGALAGWYGRRELAGPIAAAGVSLWLIASGQVPKALLIRNFSFARTARAAVWGDVAGATFAVALAVWGAGVWALVVQRLVAAGTEMLLLWRAVDWRPRMAWSAAAFRDVWQFSASRGLEGLLHYLDLHAPRFILGLVAGAGELGQFIFARRIIENTINVMLAPAKHAALPAFSSVQADLDRVRRGYAAGVGFTTAIVIPACAGIGLVAPVLIPLLVGPNWTPSIVLLQLLVLTAYRRAFHIWNAAVLRGLGRPGLLLGASVLRTVTIFGVMYLFLPWGAVGACVAAVVGNYLSWPPAIYFVKRVTGLGPWRQLQPGMAPLASAVVMAIAVTGLRQSLPAATPPWLTLTLLAATGTAIYIAAMWILDRTQAQEVAGLLRTRLRR